jgi:hypothetical protein
MRSEIGANSRDKIARTKDIESTKFGRIPSCPQNSKNKPLVARGLRNCDQVQQTGKITAYARMGEMMITASCLVVRLIQLGAGELTFEGLRF